MGWSSSQYKFSNKSRLSELQKARALSGLYENPGNPILNVWNLMILERYRDVDITHYLTHAKLDEYERNRLLQAASATENGNKWETIFQPATHRTRLLVERRWGLSVEYQLYVENAIKSHIVGRFILPSSDLVCHADYFKNWDNYVSRYGLRPLKVNGFNGKPVLAESLFSPLPVAPRAVVS